jgi:AcrR family transcriptional regulator
MNVKNNQKAQNTKNNIKNVFIELLGEKSINKISVHEICKKTGVNRTTFYAHYNDVYDLMQKIIIEKENGVSALFLEPESGEYKHLTENSLEELICYIYNNAAFYRVYLNDFTSSASIGQSILATYNQHIEQLYRNQTHKSKNEIQYPFEYFKSGLIGVIKKWLHTNCQESPSELTLIIKNSLNL